MNQARVPGIRRLAAFMAGTLAVAGLMVGLPDQAYTAGTADLAPLGGAAAPAGSPSATVTLVTGDVVHLHEAGDGRTAVTVEPAPRPDGFVPQFHVSSRGEQTHVVPSDVAHLIPERLDAALFDVTGLVAQGFADGDSATLPLILGYPKDAPTTLASRAVPGTETGRRLPSVSAVAAEAEKSDVAELAAAIGQLARAVGAVATGNTVSSAQAGPLADVEKVWLDARVEVQLDRSTGQVSAPAAWAAGFDGTGATVAVLDTGVDDSHPDLAGTVLDSANFTWDDSARDLHGHGTHVASIVAGRGTASDGERRGVAPGARLLSAKVLDAEGSGFLSWIIAGMEWAAAEGADVANMSLGAPAADPETELLRAAVERLTAENGTLFVAAAGNAGCDGCVASPGDAPSALTVGAVDRDDDLAEFSSRGPTYGTHLVKPELTAPGVGIAAARADGTGEGPDPYVAYSGTSMAAPHVAGAAAILAQARPELTPGEIKGALTSTSVPNPGLDIYAQGAGRLDLGRALASPVLPSSSTVDFGFVPFPGPDPDVLHRDVTFRNVSAEPVTVELTASVTDPAGAPASAFEISPAELTIPPGAVETARVAVDPGGMTPGQYTGHLVANPGSGDALRLPLALELEAEHFDLTISAIARDGRPALAISPGWAGSPVIDVRTGQPMWRRCDEDPPGPAYCIQVPAGDYSVLGYVVTKPAWAESDGSQYTTTPLHTALVGDPELTVTGDTAIVLDARDAVEIEIATPDRETKANLGGAADLTWTRTPADGPPATEFLLNFAGSQLEERLFAQPTDDVTIGSFAATSRWRLEAPAVTLDVIGRPEVDLRPQYYRRDWFSDNSWQFPTVEKPAKLPLVDAGNGSADDLARADVDGALALIRRSDDLSVAEQSNNAAAAGAAMVAVYNDEPGLNSEAGPPGTKLEVPTVRLSHEEGAALLGLLESPAPVFLEADGTSRSPYVYDLVYAERGGIPAELRYTARTRDLVRLDREVHEQPGGMTFSEVSWPFEGDTGIATGNLNPMPVAPGTRTDYLVPDPGTSWRHGVWTPEAPYNYIWPQPEVTPMRLESRTRTFDAPRTVEESWFAQPLAPGLDPDRPITRRGDVLEIPIAGMVDANLNFAQTPTSYIEEGYASNFRVWHGEELIGETTGRPRGTIALPSGEEDYRITYDVENRSAWATLSTRTRTEWAFTSATSDPAASTPVPLMVLDYDLHPALDNRLWRPDGRRGPAAVDVVVGHQDGVDIAVDDLTFEVSYDDGATWQEAKERRTGDGSYTVDLGLTPPTADGFVSFRVGAVDAHGNRIEQEIIRAAAVGEP